MMYILDNDPKESLRYFGFVMQLHHLLFTGTPGAGSIEAVLEICGRLRATGDGIFISESRNGDDAGRGFGAGTRTGRRLRSGPRRCPRARRSCRVAALDSTGPPPAPLPQSPTTHKRRPGPIERRQKPPRQGERFAGCPQPVHSLPRLPADFHPGFCC